MSAKRPKPFLAYDLIARNRADGVSLPVAHDFWLDPPRTACQKDLVWPERYWELTPRHWSDSSTPLCRECAKAWYSLRHPKQVAAKKKTKKFSAPQEQTCSL